MTDDDKDFLATCIDVLLNEYQAMHALLAFRLEATEQRVPLTGAILYSLVGTAPSLEPLARTLLLLAMPAAAVWFLRTTISHLRAKQDVKLRLIELERHINELIGAELLGFQSTHPSARREVAGRTGQEAALAVYFGAIGLLAACGLLVTHIGLIESVPLAVYMGILGAAGAVMTWDLLFIRRYRTPRVRSPFA